MPARARVGGSCSAVLACDGFILKCIYRCMRLQVRYMCIEGRERTKQIEGERKVGDG